MIIRSIVNAIKPISLLATLTFCSVASATIVEFQTSEGNFQVNLYDESTPITVENFLSYVNDGAYTNNIIHRVEKNFVVQAGGFIFEGTTPLTPIQTKASIQNEPKFSNVKNTIAMAKVGGQPNSATSQWFFNLKDNSSNLDVQNGGFTVFGEVIDDGMAIVEKISNIDTCDSVPMPNFSTTDCSSGTTPGADNFVTIYQIVIVDSSSSTAANLSPKENTLINKPVDNPSDSSGGGSLGIFSLFLLAFSVGYKKLKR